MLHTAQQYVYHIAREHYCEEDDRMQRIERVVKCDSINIHPKQRHSNKMRLYGLHRVASERTCYKLPSYTSVPMQACKYASAKRHLMLNHKNETKIYKISHI